MRFDVSSPRDMAVASEIHVQFVSILESRREGTARLPMFSPPPPRPGLCAREGQDQRT